MGPARDGLVERPTHHLTIRVDTGPQLDIDRPLVEQHATAIEGPRARLTRPLQQRRVGRIRYHVADHQTHRDRVE